MKVTLARGFQLLSGANLLKAAPSTRAVADRR